MTLEQEYSMEYHSLEDGEMPLDFTRGGFRSVFIGTQTMTGQDGSKIEVGVSVVFDAKGEIPTIGGALVEGDWVSLQ